MRKIISRILFLLILIFFLTQCTTSRQERIDIKKSVEPVYRTKFPPLIEDFEEPSNYWLPVEKGLAGIDITMIEFQNNKICVLTFSNIRYCRYEYPSDFAGIQLNKSFDFSPFRGITFTAKGTPCFDYKIKIFEKELSSSGLRYEIWFKKFKIKPYWQTYSFNFNELISEEYFEQDYMGDEIFNPTNIGGIGIFIQNNSTGSLDYGKLYIDNIMVF